MRVPLFCHRLGQIIQGPHVEHLFGHLLANPHHEVYGGQDMPAYLQPQHQTLFLRASRWKHALSGCEDVVLRAVKAASDSQAVANAAVTSLKNTERFGPATALVKKADALQDRANEIVETARQLHIDQSALTDEIAAFKQKWDPDY